MKCGQIVTMEQQLIDQVHEVLVMTIKIIKTFDVDNSSSCHSDHFKNNFLVLDEGPTYGINGSFSSPEKKFSINFY